MGGWSLGVVLMMRNTSVRNIILLETVDIITLETQLESFHWDGACPLITSYSASFLAARNNSLEAKYFLLLPFQFLDVQQMD